MNKEVTKMSLVPYVIEQTNRGELFKKPVTYKTSVSKALA